MKKIYLYITIVFLLLMGVFFYFSTQDVIDNQDVIDGSELLVNIKADGGLCVYGSCFSEINIYNDGSWSYADGDGSTKSGNISKSDTVKLSKLIESTNFVKLRENKFTDTCPIAYDGQWYIYTVYANKVENINSCETAIGSSPLFKNIGEILEVIRLSP